MVFGKEAFRLSTYDRASMVRLYYGADDDAHLSVVHSFS
jgi:hypothetical protein